ncbi:4-amino-6-deoxy-N-Acetyl-D-hexosaminyl-(Lipid carrier) acetyltrasferase [Anaerovibrio sp. JC8]|uniref:NeuD/PglB/VioB family sugar acetyltransferase n=1 Tax=Anaerovibrio sp. JC8 TaxID=1240085 RepID=UPI000A0E9142|nr:NeuD/PglB/VioB family sugar acetyltransferase [Anaerovibrio sp. JC8]ORU01010.1 4-amino-6-deoxy-N-Acetyl-D-hexosaminyl-(Lipid carrier) acetyltrasferase [Anaerovibrio sp. JC8]
MEDLVLVGFGGHGKSVADTIEREGKYHIVGYTDVSKVISKYEYLGTDDNLRQIFDSGIRNAAIGIGYLGKGIIRQKIYSRLKEIGFKLPVMIDPSAVVSSSATIGEGTFIGKGTIINAEAKIGKMTIINTKALVEHECMVGDFTHVAVGAVLCGQVDVGEYAFIGANATVIQCRKVEPYKIIPAGVTIR